MPPRINKEKGDRPANAYGMVRPETDDYPRQLESVITALVSGDIEAAEKALETIAYPRRDIAQRRR